MTTAPGPTAALCQDCQQPIRAGTREGQRRYEALALCPWCYRGRLDVEDRKRADEHRTRERRYGPGRYET